MAYEHDGHDNHHDHAHGHDHDHDAAGEEGRPAPEAGPSLEAFLVRALWSGGNELIRVTNPLDAEMWASSLLGFFYKLPMNREASAEMESSLGPRLVTRAERKGNRTGLAILRALEAVSGDDIGAAEAAARMVARGVEEPTWGAEIGSAELLDAWTARDPFDDQVGYNFLYRYPGRPRHLVMALYDANLGGIIKDAAVGEIAEDVDPRGHAASLQDVRIDDGEPAVAAAEVLRAIATGDLYEDNYWTDEFKQARALVRARMLRLSPATLHRTRPDEAAGRALLEEFMSSSYAPRGDAARAIAEFCLVFRRESPEGDLLRWSPAAVELFLVDFLPRRTMLSDEQIRVAPAVLSAWVRFALNKRGLAEPFIVATEEAVRHFTPQYLAAMGQADNSPAGALRRAMLDDGVDMTDEEAVDAWLDGFNRRPEEERKKILGGSTDD